MSVACDSWRVSGEESSGLRQRTEFRVRNAWLVAGSETSEGGFTLHGPRGRPSRGESGGLEPVEGGEGLVVAGSDFLTAGDEFWQALQLAAAKGALEICDAVVVTEFLHFVISGASLGKRSRMADSGRLSIDSGLRGAGSGLEEVGGLFQRETFLYNPKTLSPIQPCFCQAMLL